MFNLDLTLIETRLKNHGLHVQSALVLPQLTKQPLRKDTLFVMLLEDNATDDDSIGGIDIQQYIVERIAVLVGLRAPGDATGVNATSKLQEMIVAVKEILNGLIFEGYEPVTFEVGRLIEVNRDTQNVLYQLQFKTAHTAVTRVKHHDELY